MLIDMNHPSIVNAKKVKAEFMGTRPLELNTRHRMWGYHITATDIDFLEYSYGGMPAAIIESKQKSIFSVNANEYLKNWNIAAQIITANNNGIPHFVAEYSYVPEYIFKMFPMNNHAVRYFREPKILSEKEYIELQYSFRTGHICQITDEVYEYLVGSAPAQSGG